MSKKLIFSIIVVFTVFTFTSIGALANDNPSGSESGSTEFHLKSDVEQNRTLSETPNEITPFATGNGTITCKASGKSGICNWTITASNDLISYSSVYVHYEKFDGKKGKWVSAGNTRHEYGINLPTKTIRDQSSIHNLSKGNYRAKLGGTFTGVKYGAYAAYASKPATFTIK